MSVVSRQQQTGADALVDILKKFNVDTAYCVPGESYLAVLESLYHHSSSLQLITCRHEAGAANMAEAYGKLTKKPGICFVTRGPGATHASIGVHTAFQDSTPMILFIGQVARDCKGREGFQEVDYQEMFRPLAKWVVEIDNPNRMSEILTQAFTKATTGRPGPVVVSLPEDMLREVVSTPQMIKDLPSSMAAPHPGELQKLSAALSSAQRPFVLVGGSCWTDQAKQQMEAWALKNKLPIATSFRSQDVCHNDHPCYAGDVGIAINPKLANNLKKSDLLIVIGPRLGEMTTGGYQLFAAPVPAQKLVHIFPDPGEIGRVYQADIAFPTSIPAFVEQMTQHIPSLPGWPDWVEENRQNYVDFSEADQLYEKEPCVNMAKIIKYLRATLSHEAIITNGAGNYAGWVHRYYRYNHFKSQLAPTSGAMGYGLPAAIAAKIAFPARQVVCFAGDGCLMMSIQELATAVRYKANIIVIVVNNNMYGTIRMHQEKNYPEHVSGTLLTNPDFCALAESFGFWGGVVEKTDDFAAVFSEALAANKPALIEIKVDPGYITPQMTLTQIQEQAKKTHD